ncbi:trypsin-like serine peptidase [Aliiroseovarius marinus]|uniref:trypsin-like serine peptidase n=1 Tax=Aliiroseovarius marinus TaxID=2500159 RepID=UPI003D7EF85F
MIRFRYLLMHMASMALLSGGATAEGNPALKRLTLRHDLLGYEAVGKLDLVGGGYCTGVLIASDLVLTAAHCLRSAVKAGHVDGLRFRAGLSDGKAIADRTAKAAVMHPGYDPRRGMSARNIETDVALVQLAQPIPTATAAPFAPSTLPARGREVSIVSYARGRDAALSRQAVCKVLDRYQGLLAFNCDVTFGSSGAPIFDASGRRPRIVSLVSGGRRTAKGALVYGTELQARVAEVKRALRAGRGVIMSTQRGPGAPPRLIKPGQSGAFGNSGNTGARFVKP